MRPSINIVWFRRDLRLNDNAALYHALKGSLPVLPIFIFDTNILTKLDNPKDARVSFIHQAIMGMQGQLMAMGSSMEVFYGTPIEVFKILNEQYQISQVFTNHDFEKYALERDAQIQQYLQKKEATFHTYKDHVIFEKSEVVKDDCKPYTVFTPYSKKWKVALNDFYLKPYPVENYFDRFYRQPPVPIPTLAQMGFEQTGIPFPSSNLDTALAKAYQQQRDFPAVRGTSHLGIHLRFGTISIRKLATTARQLSETYLNELIWRDFYHSILWHFPHVREGAAFRKEYEQIAWLNDESAFEKWCAGKTGYPIVDAGMRELNATGFMHNRVRMIVASFLTKHLLIDWRWGEQYFAKHLLDFDFAANNGGWQWAAGCGCDAAPYFRVFNPTLQTEKFDKDLKYIRKWVPELDSFSYPKPIVPHDVARKRALEVYGKALKG